MGESDDEYDWEPPADLPEGVSKEVVKEADVDSYRKPKKGDEVTVHYVGSLEADGTEFDSSRARGQPINFTLGVGEVIKGWDLAVPTMRKGEVSKITIKPEFAYGEPGQPPKIPPSATLVFEIELISWVSKDDLFNDGGVIKAIVEEGSGFENPKKDQEVCMSLKANASDGSIIDERQSLDYTPGSGVFDEKVARVVDKTLTKMKKAEKCILTCKKGYVYPAEHGQVKLELTLEEMFEVADVSFLKNRSVIKKQIKEGDAYETPRDGYEVTVKVNAVTDGQKSLSSTAWPQDVNFLCGEGEVCDAVEAAVCEMKKGERAVVTCFAPQKCIDAKLGITEASVSGVSSVVFDLELADFSKDQDMWSLSNPQKIALGTKRKDAGGRLFRAKRFELALEKYKKVAEVLNNVDSNNEDWKLQAAELKRTSELNKAACYLQLGECGSALISCDAVLKEDKVNVKALFRRAKAHHGRAEFLEAIHDVERVLELDPANTEARALLPQLKREQRLADKESQSTFAKMCKGFGKLGADKENRQPEKKKEEPRPAVDPRALEMVSVTFRVEYETEPEESVFVVGAAEELGAWDLSKAVQMTRKPAPKDWRALATARVEGQPDGRPPKEPNPWEVMIDVNQSAGKLLYNYLIRGPGGDRLEEGHKHAIQLGGLGGSRARSLDKWGEGAAYDRIPEDGADEADR
mmetsp:Transcript_20166/g.47000  ORF Transcript_20166/g.47000 Transcript_20166/m.47000 type:complete len:691 (+) Transcript_20166:64-2136(+)